MRRLMLSALSVNTLAAGFGLAMAVPAAPAAAQQWREITCESWNYREAACPVPGAVRVQLLRVRGGECIEGQTWYQDGSTIRVRNGCRAVFRIDANNGWGVGGWDPNWNGNRPGYERWQVIRCESWNYRDQRCAVGGVIGNARLLRVIAGDCRDGATWRWDRRALYVRNGCRADFEVQQGATGWGNGGGGGWGSGPGGGGYYPPGGGGGFNQSINCESWNYRPARCAIPNARAVRIGRVLGGTCIEGRSWGWSPGAIWVNGGCRATFYIN
ncbi:DUF3011 domain-containing protein [Sandarakinorhabdus oryzae]|uniref:DUF3011 domain-containing protein n=1 Tax=Sandarakinorhabdus oryzae TaxID=2675220 RepID=UPI0012E2F514|nr:DUF3011 domain-containing protein [Sandarakinorhabdus oryzae]